MNTLNKVEDAVDRLKDTHEIEQVLYRYARAVDRADWDLLRSVYHPDAYDDHGGYRGDVEGFVAYVIARHRNIEHSAHHLSNICIDFVDQDVAVVETHCHAFQRFGPGSQRILAFGDEQPIVTPGMAAARITGILRYVDRFERRDGKWAIAERTVVSGDLTIEQLEEPVPFGPDRVIQRHDLDDHVYKLLSTVRGSRTAGWVATDGQSDEARTHNSNVAT